MSERCLSATEARHVDQLDRRIRHACRDRCVRDLAVLARPAQLDRSAEAPRGAMGPRVGMTNRAGTKAFFHHRVTESTEHRCAAWGRQEESGNAGVLPA